MSSAVQYSPGDEAPADAALARRIADGDRSAESALCARLLPRIRVWAKLRTRSDASAADLAQEVMLTVLEKLRANAIDDLGRLSGYVAGVCRLTHVAWLRGERRRATLLEVHGFTLSPEYWPTEPTLDRQRLADCFEKLSQRGRALLAMSLFGDQTSEDIAQELASTASAVRVMRHRALADLHRCVEGET